MKKSKTEPPETSNGDSEPPQHEGTPSDSAANNVDQRANAPDAGLNLAPPPLPPNRSANAATIAQPTPVSAPQLPSLTSNSQSCKLHTDPALRDMETESLSSFELQ